MCSKSKVISTTRGNTKKTVGKEQSRKRQTGGNYSSLCARQQPIWRCPTARAPLDTTVVYEYWYDTGLFSTPRGKGGLRESEGKKSDVNMLTACCPSGESRKESTGNVLVRWCTGCCYCCCSGVIEGDGGEDKNTMSVHIANRLNRALCK